ncbi:hypothetical protein ABT116_10165 [Streptomyces sp. NPDC002130]|uniref:hypothetical protein n=1 Tax=Streptomyces sp. NPDC002130 TaxID=3155568 RepID=UPI0033255576
MHRLRAVSTAAPRRYIEPAYGFVAARGPQRRPGQAPPRRSWYGDVRMFTATADGMVVVSEGPGGAGYEIRDWCGWGRRHAELLSRREAIQLRARVLAWRAHVTGSQCGP